MLITLFFIAYEFHQSSPGEYEIQLQPGKYFIECYGADGGQGYDSEEKLYGKPGKGAYTSGYLSLTSQTKNNFFIRVGGKGVTSNESLLGGYNGGGKSGKSLTSCEQGSGGGASDIRFGDNSTNNRIMVAAGGSGGICTVSGAPGGDLLGRTRDYTYLVIDSLLTTQTKGNGPEIGGDGPDSADSDEYAGSGGGRGYQGGVSKDYSQSIYYRAVNALSESGSSYISGYTGCTRHSSIAFEDAYMESNQYLNHSGNGEVIITAIYKCIPYCSSCSDGNTCDKCIDNYKFHESQKACVESCPIGTYELNSVCIDCDPTCKECEGSASKCTSCDSSSYFHENRCYTDCPAGTYKNGNQCLQCSDSCSTCSDSETNCYSCKSPYALLNDTCVKTCPEKMFNENGKCAYCDSLCNGCSDTAFNCLNCFDGYILYNSSCFLSCPLGTYEHKNNCLPCDSNCYSCSSNNQCYKCASNYVLYNNQCYLSCPTHTYELNGICYDCATNCAECKSVSNLCTKCDDGMILDQGECVYDQTTTATQQPITPTSKPIPPTPETSSITPTTEPSSQTESTSINPTEETSTDLEPSTDSDATTTSDSFPDDSSSGSKSINTFWMILAIVFATLIIIASVIIFLIYRKNRYMHKKLLDKEESMSQSFVFPNYTNSVSDVSTSQFTATNPSELVDPFM